MGKLISYWKSNSKTELGFYGLDNKNHTRLSDTDIKYRLQKLLLMLMMILKIQEVPTIQLREELQVVK